MESMTGETKRPSQNAESLGQDLRNLLNRHSAENTSDTPDWILAGYMLECLVAFERATDARDAWYGRGKGSYQ